MNIKTKQQLINHIKATPIADIIITSGKANQRPVINKFTAEQSQYILIKLGTEGIK